jgi:aspartyl-tRNA(Asn)/glutamyl-tRNA(Gln) amidotransferase subunit A
MAYAALGSDTGGSIRGPASWCGIVGFKPTYGLVSRRGVMPLSWTLDHVGPMTRTVEDAAIVLQAIAGHDPQDDGSANVPIPEYRSALGELPSKLTIGVPWAYLEGRRDISPESLGAFRAAMAHLESRGAQVQPIDMPYAQQAGDIGTAILVSEAYAFHEQGFRDHLELYGRPFRERVVRGTLYSAADYIQATRARARFCRAVGELMADVDLIATPTSPVPAEPFHSDPGAYYNRPSFTRLFNISGQPSISLPCGFTEGGLPIGLMLSGRPFDDLTVLQVAHAYEQSHEWHRRRPKL